MHNLIDKYIKGEITPKEKEKLFALAKSDTECKKDLLSAINLYALSGWLPLEKDADESIEKLRLFKKEKASLKTKAISIKNLLGYAAAICIAILTTWIIMNDKRNQSPIELAAISYEEFTTPSGQRAQVKLHDGTVVWLNARSTLRYPNRFDKKERRVELNGEAYFDVSKDATCPFIVTTEKMNIKVLGTKFNVFAYQGSSNFSTSLMEGSVEVYDSKNNNNIIRIKPNERVELVNGKWEKSTFQNDDFLLWKDGIYAFDDMTFGEIVKKLELYYDISIIVNNPSLKIYKFSGKFRQRDGVESMLQTLQKIHSFSYIKDSDRNMITIN